MPVDISCWSVELITIVNAEANDKAFQTPQVNDRDDVCWRSLQRRDDGGLQLRPLEVRLGRSGLQQLQHLQVNRVHNRWVRFQFFVCVF